MKTHTTIVLSYRYGHYLCRTWEKSQYGHLRIHTESVQSNHCHNVAIIDHIGIHLLLRINDAENCSHVKNGKHASKMPFKCFLCINLENNKENLIRNNKQLKFDIFFKVKISLNLFSFSSSLEVIRSCNIS